MINHIHITETHQDIFRSLLEEYVEKFDEFEPEAYGGALKVYCEKALNEFNIIFVEDGMKYPQLEEWYRFGLHCFVTGAKMSYTFPNTNKTYRYEDAKEALDRLGKYFELLKAYEIPWAVKDWDNDPITNIKH